MRPVPIPGNLIWEGATRRIIGPPDGDFLNPHIVPVEALMDEDGIAIRMVLEDDDIEKLKTHPYFWMHLSVNQLPVFWMHVETGLLTQTCTQCNHNHEIEQVKILDGKAICRWCALDDYEGDPLGDYRKGETGGASS